MKTTSYNEVCQDQGLEFVEMVRQRRDLAEDEFYALMVTDYNGASNPHVIGVDFLSHQYLVGLERPSKNKGCYISKNFYDRKATYRGTTIIVRTKNPENYTILD